MSELCTGCPKLGHTTKFSTSLLRRIQDVFGHTATTFYTAAFRVANSKTGIFPL